MVWVDGTTGSGNGTDNGVIAELGYGADGSTADDTWTWVSAYADGTVDGNNDQVSASLNIADAGTYSYSYRYRYDSSCWFYASETGSVTVNALTEYAVTFDLDMTFENITGEVGLFGIDGDWSIGELMSDTDGDGIYSVTLNLTAGSYLYKYKNSGNWESVDGTTCAVLDDPDGDGWGYYDREVVVSDSDLDLDTVCFSACEACVGGCTDANANNYDATANADDDSCDYSSSDPAANLFFSEAAEGTSNNKYLEIYNASDATVSLTDYSFVTCGNACSDWEYTNSFTAEASISPGDVYVLCHGSASEGIQAECDQTYTYMSNGDDAFGLFHGPTNTLMDVVGTPGDGSSYSPWEVAGTSNGTKDHTIVRKDTVLSGNTDWSASAGTDVDNSEWIVTAKPEASYTPSTLGSHPHSVGCTDSTATNYDDSADISDGSCEYACDDVDEDNVCDDVDDCVGAFDECGVCNGTGPVEDYDCDGNLLVSVTFNVDMSEQTVDTEGYGLDLFMPSPYGYHDMTDEDGDGVWSVTLTLVAETAYSYKFKNGGAWEANFNDLGCGDGSSYGNRTFTSADADQSLDTVCFSSCSACVTCAYDGDTNFDGIVNVSDIVMIVGWIIGNGDADICTSDVNGDGILNVSDVVMIVGWIVGNRADLDDATNADVVLSDNTISISANGYIAGIQMTLSHDNNFSIDLIDAYIAEYLTTGNTTKLIVVSSQSSLNHIATCNGSFDVESVVVVNSNQEIADVNILNLEPVELTLAGPNPFNPTTSLNVIVANDGYVSVNVYNIVGQHVATLLSGYMDANTSGYTVNWNASNLSSGVYLVRAETAGSISTQKLMLLK